MALIQRTTYELAVNSWTPSSVITIATPDGIVIAHVPHAFVQTGGNNTWEYIYEVVDMLVNQRGGQIRSQAGEPVLRGAAPAAGMFIYNHPDIASIAFTAGPTYYSWAKPIRPNPASSAGSSTTHGESRTNAGDAPGNQASFRTAVIARDTRCLVSQKLYLGCQAAHLVPKCRPDVYRRIQGLPSPQMYRASVGILLRDDLHSSFDRMQWSLYYKGGTMFVHVFNRNIDEEPSFHGRAIPSDRYNDVPASFLPDPDFVRWHYAQAVKVNLRGFAEPPFHPEG